MPGEGQHGLVGKGAVRARARRGCAAPACKHMVLHVPHMLHAARESSGGCGYEVVHSASGTSHLRIVTCMSHVFVESCTRCGQDRCRHFRYFVSKEEHGHHLLGSGRSCTVSIRGAGEELSAAPAPTRRAQVTTTWAVHPGACGVLPTGVGPC